MDWLKLPEPRSNIALAFKDAAGAKAWLAAQPQAQAMHMLAAICLQVEAIEGSTLAPAQAYELLNSLWSPAIPAENAIEPRYSRKALPLPEEDERAFDAAQRLWLRFGIAYLRIAPDLAADARLRTLQRAANALRMAQYCHFNAARSCPPEIDHLLFGVLAQANAAQILEQSVVDRDFPHLGEANISGLIVWAFLLRLADPYRLSSAQLTVANRGLSRWRELANFTNEPASESKSRLIDLSYLFGGPLPVGVPALLEVRKVRRKILQRIDALEKGESPESLKLGRELSSYACVRLLHLLEASLKPGNGLVSTEVGEIELAFGAENAFAVFNGEYLNSPVPQEKQSSAIAHQRMAIFGFDRQSSLPTAVKKLNVPGENWTLVDGVALRPEDRGGERRASPCLIASKLKEQPRLGVIASLQTRPDNALQAGLDWYDGRIEARFVRQSGMPGEAPARIPVFLIQGDKEKSLLVPPQVRAATGKQITLEGSLTTTLTLCEVVERGVDFVRYAAS